jgi:hypothetical protein
MYARKHISYYAYHCHGTRGGKQAIYVNWSGFIPDKKSVIGILNPDFAVLPVSR